MNALRVIQIGAFALLAVAGIATMWPARQNVPQPPDSMNGKAAPSLPAQLQGRVVLVNFFASWCLPCKAEHPLLKKLRQYGIASLGIVYRDRAAAPYLVQNGNPYTALMQDPEGVIAARYKVLGVPDSFLIDKHGIVRAHVAGPLTEDSLREVLAAAERLK